MSVRLSRSSYCHSYPITTVPAGIIFVVPTVTQWPCLRRRGHPFHSTISGGPERPPSDLATSGASHFPDTQVLTLTPTPKQQHLGCGASPTPFPATYTTDHLSLQVWTTLCFNIHQGKNGLRSLEYIVAQQCLGSHAATITCDRKSRTPLEQQCFNSTPFRHCSVWQVLTKSRTHICNVTSCPYVRQ